MNLNFYKLFNPELKFMNNIQLINHWKINGSKNGLLCSIESFLKKYIYFNNTEYKLYNPDILINDNIELMVHWHLYGLQENRICSNDYFNILYPEFNINDLNHNNNDIYYVKSLYHKNNINKNIDDKYLSEINLIDNSIINFLNCTKETIGIIINNIENIDKYNNYFLKALSLLNYHTMNIIIFIENLEILKKVFVFKNIYYYYSQNEEDKKLCNYLIYDEYYFKDNNILNIFKKVFINYNSDYLEDYNKLLITNNNIFIIDDLFDNIFLENNYLITEYNNYIINNNNLYKVENDLICNNINNINNKLFITEDFLNYDSYSSYFEYEKLKIIKFNNYSNNCNNNNFNTINYGIIYYNNNYYYNYFDKYCIIDFNILKMNMLHNIDFIYVEDSHFLINYTHNNINFKINIIFIINEKNINNYNINLLFLLNQQYNNYNLIIFLNNIEINNIEKYKSSNIYIFKSNNTLTNIEIITSLTQLASNHSLIIIIDNNYLINPLFSLEFINKLFFSKKILVTDYYSNAIINILTFKKELLSELEILDKNNDIEFMNLLYIFLKDNSFNKYFLKEYNFTYNNEKLNKKKYFIKKEYNLINNYYDYFFDNYSIEKIYLLNNNLKIFNNINNDYLENLILNYKNDYNKELNFLINIYTNNITNYNILLSKLVKNIKNINCDNQIIIYIDYNITNIFYDKLLNIISKIKQDSNVLYQINIIDVSNSINKNMYENENINYFFLKDNFNYLLCYNLINKVFIHYLFKYKNLIFCTSNEIDKLDSIFNINKNLLMKNIDNIIFVNNKLFEDVGNFDNELFIENNNYGLIYFFEKIKKKTDKYEITDLSNTKSLNSSFNNLANLVDNYDNYNNDEQKIYSLKYNKNNNIFFDFIVKRNLLNYDLNTIIKPIIINLDSRIDRLNHTIKECEKIGFYNYQRFSAINFNDLKNKNYTLINSRKSWKKDIEYLKSASGCKYSHYEVLKQYCNSDYEYIMILEDDVVFEINTNIYINLALNNLINSKLDFDILYLSSNLKNKDDAVLINNNLLKIENGLTTTALIFKTKNINKVLNNIQYSEIEIDNTYNKYLTNKYCVYPMCVYQKESYSDINKCISNYGFFHKKYNYD